MSAIDTTDPMMQAVLKTRPQAPAPTSSTSSDPIMDAVLRNRPQAQPNLGATLGQPDPLAGEPNAPPPLAVGTPAATRFNEDFLNAPAPTIQRDPHRAPAAPTLNPNATLPRNYIYPGSVMAGYQQNQMEQQAGLDSGGNSQRGAVAAGAAYSGGMQQAAQSWDDLLTDPRSPNPIKPGDPLRAISGMSQPEAQGAAAVAQHAGPVAGFVGPAVGGLAPGFADPVGLASMAAAGPVGKAVMGAPEIAALLSRIEKTAGPTAAKVAGGMISGPPTFATMSAADAAIRHGDRWRTDPEGGLKSMIDAGARGGGQGLFLGPAFALAHALPGEAAKTGAEPIPPSVLRGTSPDAAPTPAAAPEDAQVNAPLAQVIPPQPVDAAQTPPPPAPPAPPTITPEAPPAPATAEEQATVTPDVTAPTGRQKVPPVQTTGELPEGKPWLRQPGQIPRNDAELKALIAQKRQAARDRVQEQSQPKATEEPAAPADPNERITGAFVKAQGQTFTGKNHGEALAAMDRALGTGEDFTPPDADTGFVTSTGRQVSREEAAGIAGQYGIDMDHPGSIRSEELQPLKQSDGTMRSELRRAGITMPEDASRVDLARAVLKSRGQEPPNVPPQETRQESPPVRGRETQGQEASLGPGNGPQAVPEVRPGEPAQTPPRSPEPGERVPADPERPSVLNPDQPTGKALSKSQVESELVRRHLDTTGADQTGEDGEPVSRTFYNKNAPGGVAESDKLPAKQMHALLPGEIREAFTPEEARKAGFQVSNKTVEAQGEDHAYDIGWNDYIDRAREDVTGELSPSKVDAAKKFFRNNEGDPEARLLSALHDKLGQGKRAYTKIGMVEPSKLKAGDTFTIAGAKVRVVKEGEYLILKDGDDLPDTPVDALSKVPVDKGTLGAPKNKAVRVYHGSEFKFDSLRADGNGNIFFTDSTKDAHEFSQWSGKSGHVRPFDLTLNNPLVVDFKGEIFEPAPMDSAIRAAKSSGHDGVIVKNIVNFEGGKPSTTYIAFDERAASSPEGTTVQDSHTKPPRNDTELKQRIKEKRNAQAQQQRPEATAPVGNAREGGEATASPTGDAGKRTANEQRPTPPVGEVVESNDVQGVRRSGDRNAGSDAARNVRGDAEASPVPAGEPVLSEEKPNTIGLSKADQDAIRQSTGLSELPESERRGWEQVLESAKKNKADENALDTAQEVLKSNRAMTDEEHAGAVLKAADLSNRLDEAVAAASKVVEKGGDADAIAAARAKVDVIKGNLDTLTAASRNAGREAGRALSIRRMMVDRESMKLADLIDRAQTTKGEKVSSEEMQRLEGIARMYETLSKKHADAEKLIQKQKAENEKLRAGQMVKRAAIRQANEARTDVRTRRRAIELNGILKDIRSIGVRTNEITSAGAEALYHVGRLALHFAKGGLDKLEDIVKKVQEHVPDATPEEIARAINMRDPKMQARAKTETIRRMEALKDEARQMTRLQDLAEKQKAEAPAKSAAAEAKMRWQQMAIAEKAIADKASAEAKSQNKSDAQAHAAANSAVKEWKRQDEQRAKTEARQQAIDAKRTAREQQRSTEKAKKQEADRLSKTDAAQMQMVLKQLELSTKAGREEGAKRDAILAKIKDIRQNLAEQSRPLKKGQPAPPPADIAALKQQVMDLRKQMRTEDSISDLKQQIDSGDFKVAEKMQPRADTPEVARLKIEQERLRQQARGMIEKMRPRTAVEKVAETWNKWVRFGALSHPTVLAKLTGAAAIRTISTPIEQGVGAAISKALPRLAEAAPREGVTSISGAMGAERDAMVRMFTKGIKGSVEMLKNKRTDLELQQGSEQLPPEISDYLGRLHGALKNPVKEAEYARSLRLRTDHAIRNGVDISDPITSMRLSNEAYQDANRSIFMQDNKLTDAWKRGLKALTEPDKATGKPSVPGQFIAAALRTEMPIVKVPINVVGETTQILTGWLTGPARAAFAYAKGIENLKPVEADAIMRQMKKGSIGAAMLALGFFAPGKVGGFYQPGEHRKPDEPQPGDIGPVPHLLLHNPYMESMQFGATIRRVADARLSKKQADPNGTASGMAAAAFGLIDEIPFVRETTSAGKLLDPKTRESAMSQRAAGLAVPGIVQWIAKQTDRDENGPVTRHPTGPTEAIKASIPGLRSTVPEFSSSFQVRQKMQDAKAKGDTSEVNRLRRMWNGTHSGSDRISDDYDGSPPTPRK